MYEELGCPSTSTSTPVTSTSSSTSIMASGATPYNSSFSSTLPQYNNAYSYSPMQSSYMGSFGSSYSNQFSYDSRSMYYPPPPSSAAPPRAFVPHSAINLSVKPPDLPTPTPTSIDLSSTSDQSSQYLMASTTGDTTSTSPQLLDLTRSVNG